jgi:hypothetical protein
LELKSPAFSAGKRTDIPFVRRTVANSWDDELEVGLARKIEEKFARTMRQLRYLP